MKTTIVVLNKHGDNAVPSLLDALHSFDLDQVSHFNVSLPKRQLFEKSLGIMNRQGFNSSTVLGCISSQKVNSSGYNFLQLDDFSLVFEGKIYSLTLKKDLNEQLFKEPQHCETILQTIIEKADGDYAFWMIKDNLIVAGRDPLGMQPLYFGENQNIVAYATNRKALWRLGIRNATSFPPGALAFADKDGFKFKPIKNLEYAPPKQITLDEAAHKLEVLLVESIRRRTQGLKEVAVAFSGGLDSSLVAYLANKQGANVNLIHVSLENQPEIEEAIKAAETLNLPMQIHLFKESDVETILPKVVELIEEPDPIKTAIGIPFFWAAQKASESKLNVVLAGQGADELFGGYLRYVNENCKFGEEKVRHSIFNDVKAIYESNLERDRKVCGFHDVDLRCPFASYDVVKFALDLPVEYKIEKKPDTLRKVVLRKVAQNLGLSSIIVDKPKKAVQYSTGINEALKMIAKKQNKTVKEHIEELFEKNKVTSKIQ